MRPKSAMAAILAIMLAAWAAPLPAAEQAWIMSIPHAVSPEHVYKVRIVGIDGQGQDEMLRYAVTPGRHIVRVRMLLDLAWDPDLAEAPPGPGEKDITVDAEAGRTYRLAARLHADAPVEAQLDRSYWEPFVYDTD